MAVLPVDFKGDALSDGTVDTHQLTMILVLMVAVVWTLVFVRRMLLVFVKIHRAPNHE